MFKHKKTIALLLTFLGLFIASFYTYMKMGEDSFKFSHAHSLKTLYPDLRQASEEVTVTFLEERYEEAEPEKSLLEKNPLQHVEFHEQMAEILSNQALQGAITGISVRDGSTGDLLYSHQGDLRLRPASNMKLLTAIAALEVLGADYRFETEIFYDGEIKDQTLHGDLYIKGKGDPTLLKKDFDRFAKRIKEKGIQELSGNIIGDDTWYDEVRYSPDLPWTDQYNYVGAAISALTASPNLYYNASSVIVRVFPGEAIGEKPVVKIIPENDYLTIINQATTGRKGTQSGISIDRLHGTNDLIVEGSIPLGSGIEVLRSVWEPTYLALHLFRDSLTEQGISLSDQTELLRGKTPENSKSLTVRKSIPLEELIIPFMKLSNNTHGEIFIKEMGKVVYGEGSWHAGLRVLDQQLTKYGINTQNFALRDGSGMSYRNLIPPNDLTDLLYKIQQEDWFHIFLDSQPVAGNPDPLIGGTLRHRLGNPLTNGKVKAKTGTLSGVSTLSGYLVKDEGNDLIFSIMMNNQTSGWMPGIQDAIVEILATHDFSSS